MVKTISESGMECIADNAFHIEESECYSRLAGKIKTVEYVRAKNDRLIFIEAKSSFPNPSNSERFAEYIDDICDKFIHSLNLYASIAVGVTEQEMPDFKPAERVALKFVLIINGFKQQWCIPIKKAIDNRLLKSAWIVNIWKPEVFAINDKAAVKYELVRPK